MEKSPGGADKVDIMTSTEVAVVTDKPTDSSEEVSQETCASAAVSATKGTTQHIASESPVKKARTDESTVDNNRENVNHDMSQDNSAAAVVPGIEDSSQYVSSTSVSQKTRGVDELTEDNRTQDISSVVSATDNSDRNKSLCEKTITAHESIEDNGTKGVDMGFLEDFSVSVAVPGIETRSQHVPGKHPSKKASSGKSTDGTSTEVDHGFVQDASASATVPTVGDNKNYIHRKSPSKIIRTADRSSEEDGREGVDHGFLDDASALAAVQAREDSDPHVISKSACKRPRCEDKSVEDNDLVFAFSVSEDTSAVVEDRDSLSVKSSQETQSQRKKSVQDHGKLPKLNSIEQRDTTNNSKAEYEVKSGGSERNQKRTTDAPLKNSQNTTNKQKKSNKKKQNQRKSVSDSCESLGKGARCGKEASQTSVAGRKRAFPAAQVMVANNVSNVLSKMNSFNDCAAENALQRFVSQFRKTQSEVKIYYTRLVTSWFKNVKYYESRVKSYCNDLRKVKPQNKQKLHEIFSNMAILRENMENFNYTYERARCDNCPDCDARIWKFQAPIAEQIGPEVTQLEKKFHNIRIYLKRLRTQFNSTLKANQNLIDQYNSIPGHGKKQVRPLVLKPRRTRGMKEKAERKRARRLLPCQLGGKTAAGVCDTDPMATDYPRGMNLSEEIRANPRPLLPVSFRVCDDEIDNTLTGCTRATDFSEDLRANAYPHLPMSSGVGDNDIDPRVTDHIRRADLPEKMRAAPRSGWPASSRVGTPREKFFLEKLLAIQNKIMMAENCLATAQHLFKEKKKWSACEQMVRVQKYLKDIQYCMAKAKNFSSSCQGRTFAGDSRHTFGSQGPQNFRNTFEVMVRNIKKLQTEFDDLKQRKMLQLQKFRPRVFGEGPRHVDDSLLDSKLPQEVVRGHNSDELRDYSHHSKESLITLFYQDAHAINKSTSNSKFCREEDRRYNPDIFREESYYADKLLENKSYVHVNRRLQCLAAAASDIQRDNEPTSLSSESSGARKKRKFPASTTGKPVHSSGFSYPASEQFYPYPSTMPEPDQEAFNPAFPPSLTGQADRSQSTAYCHSSSQTQTAYPRMLDSRTHCPPASGDPMDTSYPPSLLDYGACPSGYDRNNFCPSSPPVQSNYKQYGENDSYSANISGSGYEVNNSYTGAQPSQTEYEGNNYLYSSSTTLQDSGMSWMEHPDTAPQQTDDATDKAWSSHSFPSEHGYGVDNAPPFPAQKPSGRTSEPYSHRCPEFGNGTESFQLHYPAPSDHSTANSWPSASMPAEPGNSTDRSYSHMPQWSSHDRADPYTHPFITPRPETRDLEVQDYGQFPDASNSRTALPNPRNVPVTSNAETRYWHNLQCMLTETLKYKRELVKCKKMKLESENSWYQENTQHQQLLLEVNGKIEQLLRELHHASEERQANDYNYKNPDHNIQPQTWSRGETVKTYKQVRDEIKHLKYLFKTFLMQLDSEYVQTLFPRGINF